MKNSSRHGFTLVELLIVIAIIGLLMALLLPAVNAARKRARQTQCSNNLAQLGKATQSYVTNPKGVFPGWMQLQKIVPNDQPVDVAISWAAKLLSKMDQQALWEQMLTDSGNNFFDNDGFFVGNPAPVVDSFICPSDLRPTSQGGYLSYVANAGSADLAAGSNYISGEKGNGIFNNLVDNPRGTVRFGADIKDGGNTTFLYSENIHKDDGTTGGPTNTWIGSTHWGGSGDLDAHAQTEQAFGMVWVFNGNEGPGTSKLPSEDYCQPFNRDTRTGAAASDPYITALGTGPLQGVAFRRPASSHSEVFLAVFVGGNTRAIAEAIDYRVYQQLLTPNGAKAVDPITSTPEVRPANRATGMHFMNPPLSDTDY